VNSYNIFLKKSQINTINRIELNQQALAMKSMYYIKSIVE
jgi:hypothetical protein